MKKKNKRKREYNNQDNGNFVAFASISLGVFAYVFCCVTIIGMVFAVLALLLAICAVFGSKKKLFPIISLFVAIIGIGFNIAAYSAVSGFISSFSTGTGNYY